MPDAIQSTTSAADELRQLTAHLALLDLDAPSLEILMAALTADVEEPVDTTDG